MSASRAHLRTVSSDRIYQILKDLRIPPNAEFDPDMLRNIATFANADILVWGRYVKVGDQIRIDGTLQDLKRDQRAQLKIDAANEKDLHGTVDQLADLVRKNLSMSADVLNELKASSFQPSSTSVPALRDYNQSLQLLRDGKNLEAVKALQAAIKEDPQFALAYSRLAETDSTLGYDADAEQNSRKAVELSQTLPHAERYLIEANHARVMKDNKKAIQAYENLDKIFPDNADVQYALGTLHRETATFDKARTEFANILKTDPKNTKALWRMGVVEIMQDNAAGALKPLNQGLSQAVQVDNQEQTFAGLARYGRFLPPAQQARRGHAQLSAVHGDQQDALASSVFSPTAIRKWLRCRTTLGKPKDALASYTQALQILKEIGMKKEYGDTLIGRGVLYETWSDYDKALQDFKESLQIQRDADDQSYQAVCLNNIGGAYLAKGDTDNALIYLQQSLQLRQKLNDPEYIAETLTALGDVYSATGEYDKALNSVMSALDVSRKANNVKGAAGESRRIGLILQYQGRLGASVSALQDAVKGYRSADNRSLEMTESLTDLGSTLALAGRGDEAGKALDEAQGLVNDIKSDTLQAELLNAQGDLKFYGGDLKSARPLYEQALRAATKGQEKDKILRSKLNLGQLAIAEGRPQSAVADLQNIVKQADTLNLKYVSLSSAIEIDRATINSKDYARARQDFERDSAAAKSSAHASRAPGFTISSAKPFAWPEIRATPSPSTRRRFACSTS